jgi:hypothetical protein
MFSLVTVSDHEVSEQPIQPRGWTAFVEELRSSRRAQRRGKRTKLTSVTLAEDDRGVQLKEFIAMMRLVNRRSISTEDTTGRFINSEILSDLISNSSNIARAMRARLAVALPEVQPVTIEQHERAYPFRAFLRVQVRHNQPQRLLHQPRNLEVPHCSDRGLTLPRYCAEPSAYLPEYLSSFHGSP